MPRDIFWQSRPDVAGPVRRDHGQVGGHCLLHDEPIPIAKSWEHKDIGGGTKWIGDSGWISVTRGHFDASNKEWAETYKRGKKHVEEAEAKWDFKLLVSTNHNAQFIDCIKSRKPTVSPLDQSVRSDTISQLCDIAVRTKRKITWDPKTCTIVGDPEATKMMHRDMRARWTL